MIASDLGPTGGHALYMTSPGSFQGLGTGDQGRARSHQVVNQEHGLRTSRGDEGPEQIPSPFGGIEGRLIGSLESPLQQGPGGHPQEGGRGPRDDLGVVEASQADIPCAAGHPSDRGCLSSMLIDPARNRGAEGIRRCFSPAQLQSQDQIARVALVEPGTADARKMRQLVTEGRERKVGGARRAERNTSFPASHTRGRCEQIENPSEHDDRLVSGCDTVRWARLTASDEMRCGERSERFAPHFALGAFFPALQVGTLLGREFVDAHAHRLEFQARDLFIDLGGHFVDLGLEGRRVGDDPLARQGLVRE